MKQLAYDTQLQSIPGVVGELIARNDAAKLYPRRPIIFSGIGTSLHAARVAADWVMQLTSGRVRAAAVDAHDLGAGIWPLRAEDQVVVISHRGTKTYPTASLRRAKAEGCFAIAIVGQTAPEQAADITLRTCANETAGTFSVSYLATLAVLARLVARTFPEEAGSFAHALAQLPRALSDSLQMMIAEEWVRGFAERAPILIAGFGPDFVTAQEAALKIKEGAWLWTEAMSPEFALHGTPASYHPGMSAIVMIPALDDGGRSRELANVLKRLKVGTVATCGAAATAADLTFAQPDNSLLRPFTAILPFHLLTAALAKLRDTDPDTLHGHRTPWKEVMTGLRL